MAAAISPVGNISINIFKNSFSDVPAPPGMGVKDDIVFATHWFVIISIIGNDG